MQHFLMRGTILLCLLTVPSAQRSAVPMAKAFMPFTRTGNPLARQILEGRFAAKDVIHVECKDGMMRFGKH